MVQVTITYTTNVTNTGVPNDIIVGCSLMDSTGQEEMIRLPWWVIWDVGTGGSASVTLNASGDITPANYLAITRAWTGHIVGTKFSDITYDGNIVGAAYKASWDELMIPPALDEATQTLAIGVGGISATIDDFNITI